MLQQTNWYDVKEVILAGNTRLQEIYEYGKSGDEGSSPAGDTRV